MTLRTAAAFLAAALAASPFAARAAVDAKALFLENCATCHGEDGKADTPKGKNLMARKFADAEWQAGEADSALIKSVTNGKEDMPPFGKKLTKEQIESLVKNDVRGFVRRD
jgi:mono/diheme cytochrome c family protein